METQDMINEEEVRRLPLWKDWIERNEHRLAYGLTVTTEEMEAALEEKFGSVEFNMEILNIRMVLRHRGMNFSQRGLRGAGFHIAPPNTNADEMERMNRLAMNSSIMIEFIRLFSSCLMKKQGRNKMINFISNVSQRIGDDNIVFILNLFHENQRLFLVTNLFENLKSKM